MSILDELDELREQAVAAIGGAGTPAALEDTRVAFLGRKARLPMILRGVRDLPDDERREVATRFNALRQELEAAVAQRRAELERSEEDALLASDRIDLTMPGREPRRGAPDPLVEVSARIEDTFVGMGYRVAEGPEVEDDWHNFEALNTPPDHPARSLMDTYYVEGPSGPLHAVLRTHTSPVQIRTMESQSPPIYVICPGRVYRREDTTVTNSAIFHQAEGLAVDEGLTFADLKGTLDVFARAVFGPDARSRVVPSFYPFTEPSAEVQVTCPLCGGQGCSQCASGWLGMGGAGMVDPNVFRFVGIDPERYSGFAFGMSIERPAMLRYGVADIRSFLDGDVRFHDRFRGIPVS